MHIQPNTILWGCFFNSSVLYRGHVVWRASWDNPFVSFIPWSGLCSRTSPGDPVTSTIFILTIGLPSQQLVTISVYSYILMSWWAHVARRPLHRAYRQTVFSHVWSQETVPLIASNLGQVRGFWGAHMTRYLHFHDNLMTLPSAFL